MACVGLFLLASLLPFDRLYAQDKNNVIVTLCQKAESGDTEAMLSLGCYYYQGTNGVQADYTQAYNWVHKAAHADNHLAMGLLGIYYYYGIAVQKDFQQAFNWIHKAVEKCDAQELTTLGDAMFVLGILEQRSFCESKNKE